MVHLLLKEKLTEQVRHLLTEAGLEWPDSLDLVIEHPAHVEHGDFSTTIALLLAKTLSSSPLSIATAIKHRLEQGEENGEVLFSRIEVVPPGFLNFYVDWQVWSVMDRTVSQTSASPAMKVLIEHTSINPNKSAHIGHLRNSCIGDTLARMMTKAGHQVEVHNYIDDLGNQLADTVVGLLHTPSTQPHTRFGDFCWDTYAHLNKAYTNQSELQDKRSEVLHQLEQGQSSVAWIGSLVAERIVREQLEEMAAFNIRYDVLVWESHIVKGGLWDAAFNLLKETGLFHKVTTGKLAGCWVLEPPQDSTEDGETNDLPQQDYTNAKVLVRSNGILTYTAKDIAYHLWKFGLLDSSYDFRYIPFTAKLWSTHTDGKQKPIGRANQVINVIDYRQKYPQDMVRLALNALGFTDQANQLKHISYGVVSLSPATAASLGLDVSDGKSSYAMSGRQGIGIKVKELLDHMEQVIASKRTRKAGLSSRAIAAASLRYYLLRFHLETEVVFDMQQATEVSGNSGVYLLYACARANRILQKSARTDQGNQACFNDEQTDYSDLEPSEYRLLRHIAYWPETLQSANRQLAPNVICNYAFELASLFSQFYNNCPILTAPGNKKNLRLSLTRKFIETLEQALHLLGMPAPKRM